MKITIDRATVEQALEALEAMQSYAAAERKGLRICDEAITALRAALAQQAEPVEPVAHRVVAGALFDFMGWLTSRRERLVLSSIDDAAPAADAIKDFAEMRGLSLDDAKVQDWNAALAQQAEPVEPVEPVAWRWGYRSVTTGEMDWRGYVEIAAHPNLRSPEIIMEPLYTAPPQRKPLTEEEIERIRAAEQDRCCRIIFGMAGSDNVAQRTVEKIRGKE